jgi:hypothetical protein
MQYILNNIRNNVRNWRTLLNADFVPFIRNDFYQGLSPWHHARYDKDIYAVYTDCIDNDPNYDDCDSLEDIEDYRYDFDEYETADQAMFSDSLNYR